MSASACGIDSTRRTSRAWCCFWRPTTAGCARRRTSSSTAGGCKVALGSKRARRRPAANNGGEDMTLKINRREALMAALAVPAILKSGQALAAKELRVMAWDGYADDDWVKEFQDQTGAVAKVVFIGTDDEIWAKIKGSEGKDFDVFAVNTAQLQRYIDGGLTTPHDLSKLPNQKNVLPRFQDLSKVKGIMRDGKVHSIPFCFDSIGLIYDKSKVDPAPDSFKVLWDPKYQGKILAYDNG